MSDDDYEVGYKKPPVGSRFKKGESGNRTGRPGKKPKKKAYELIEDALNRPVKVKQANGRVVKMPLLEAGIEKLVREFANGDDKARKTVLSYLAARGDMAPADKKGFSGVAVLYRPSATAKEWSDRYAGVQRPLDPLEGLPGIDADPINRARITLERPSPSPRDDE